MALFILSMVSGGEKYFAQRDQSQCCKRMGRLNESKPHQKKNNILKSYQEKKNYPKRQVKRKSNKDRDILK